MFYNPLVPFGFGGDWFGHDKCREITPAQKKREFLLNDEAFVKMLVDDVNSAYESIDIVEGVENIELYDDERVVKAFEDAVKRGVKVRFVLKPSAVIG